MMVNKNLELEDYITMLLEVSPRPLTKDEIVLALGLLSLKDRHLARLLGEEMVKVISDER